MILIMTMIIIIIIIQALFPFMKGLLPGLCILWLATHTCLSKLYQNYGAQIFKWTLVPELTLPITRWWPTFVMPALKCLSWCVSIWIGVNNGFQHCAAVIMLLPCCHYAATMLLLLLM